MITERSITPENQGFSETRQAQSQSRLSLRRANISAFVEAQNSWISTKFCLISRSIFFLSKPKRSSLFLALIFSVISSAIYSEVANLTLGLLFSLVFASPRLLFRTDWRRLPALPLCPADRILGIVYLAQEIMALLIFDALLFLSGCYCYYVALL